MSHFNAALNVDFIDLMYYIQLFDVAERNRVTQFTTGQITTTQHSVQHNQANMLGKGKEYSFPFINSWLMNGGYLCRLSFILIKAFL